MSKIKKKNSIPKNKKIEKYTLKKKPTPKKYKNRKIHIKEKTNP